MLDFETQMDHPTPARKPDIINKKQTCPTWPLLQIMNNTSEKLEKYLNRTRS